LKGVLQAGLPGCAKKQANQSVNDWVEKYWQTWGLFRLCTFELNSGSRHFWLLHVDQ
jgi:hypothetical protein